MTEQTKPTFVPTVLTIEAINEKIQLVITAEKITKAKLGELSRDLLAYVYETKDVDAINRLLAGLTPVNQRVAAIFFAEHVAWTFDADTNAFGKQKKPLPLAKGKALAFKFLEDDANTMWTWSATSIEVVRMKEATTKPKDYADKISKLVKKAINDEEEGINAATAIQALLSVDGISVADLMLAVKASAADPVNDLAGDEIINIDDLIISDVVTDTPVAA